MQLIGEPTASIRPEAWDLINLYASLGERAESFLPKHIIDNLRSFVRLCYEEPDDPAKQQAEINRYILEFNEDIPGYIDVSLMLFPHEDSKAFNYSSKRLVFKRRLMNFIDTESLDEKERKWAENILNSHDFSVGTPPVTTKTIEFLSKMILGDNIRDLRKFRDVIGVIGEIEEAHWNYFMDTMDQMITQSTHYTTKPEKDDFLHRSEWTVNFKGLNGLIRTVVSGNSDTAVELIAGEVFSKESVVVVPKISDDELFEKMTDDSTSIFVVKVPHMRKNIYSGPRWFQYMTRLVFVDDSSESKSSNTSLVFSFHNGIINTLNKVHTKKLGAPANTQLNLRLILENVNLRYLERFRSLIEEKINNYNEELAEFQNEQLGTTKDESKNIALYRLDSFVKQILRDRYSLEKLRDFILFIQNTIDENSRKRQTEELMQEFESRTKAYFYSDIEQLQIATILEGGGRNQIKTYGEFLLQKELKNLRKDIIDKIQVIIDIIPDNYKRTLHNHFHKNFGVNLFLEKYQEYLTKVDNESDNKGRYYNFLIDLGIYELYIGLPEQKQDIIKEFLARLGNLDKTSISDDVQMIIRDLLFIKGKKPKPYIIYNQQLGWEYKDLFPDDRFDINPFDIEIENTDEGRIDYERLFNKLVRIKNTLSLFDETGNLWDRFCDNLTILINDPANPTGYSDFNSETLINLLRFLNNSKITLFLDEAYNDGVKIEDRDQPKWRTISRYVLNNINSMSKISLVSSLSTTKNLGATGDRLGSLVATPARTDLVEFARKKNPVHKGNSNSLYMLNCILETAQIAKKLKDRLDEQLPKDASRYKIKEYVEEFLVEQSKNKISLNTERQKNKMLKTITHFEGSPVYLFLLDELAALDKLDVLGVPDDFKYKGEPFFSYWQNYIVKTLNLYRVNRIFRTESNNRLKEAKRIAGDIVKSREKDDVIVLESDGSYLFNIQLREFSSYADLELFLQELASKRGIAVLPYSTGVVRFSLGGHLEGDQASYDNFNKEIQNGLAIFFKYWDLFYQLRTSDEKASMESEEILSDIFGASAEFEFLNTILEDYSLIRSIEKKKSISLKISDIRGLYHASPELSGITINTIGGSKNSVIEFQGEIGKCRSVEEFIRSRAFTKVYENLLAQIYSNIPLLRNLDFNTIASKYSKATILKYISNKKRFHPNHFVLDDPEEINIMREILIEMENLLFSDSKVKILALNSSNDPLVEKARLEGINRILKKFIQEILLHFNLPFEKEVFEPSRKEIIEMTREKFEDFTGLQVEEINLENWWFEFVDNNIRNDKRFRQISISSRNLGYLFDIVTKRILGNTLSFTDKILYLYLFKNDNSFAELIFKKLQYLDQKISEEKDEEMKMLKENIIFSIMEEEFNDIVSYIWRKKDIKISEENLHLVTQKVVLFFIELINKTKGTLYYKKYTHVLIKVVETEFKKQNSSFNEMIQHGITIHRWYKPEKNILNEYNNGELSWITDVMSKCGVVGTEQSVQTHTRIVTDAKKREYPFHKVDRPDGYKKALRDNEKNGNSKNMFIRTLDTRPNSRFFARRLARFIANMDIDDYRCKISNHGLFNELYIFQKSYMKYMTDNYRLLMSDDISLDELNDFVPDIITFYGAPEKVISFPQIGFFDIPGPKGNIKTIVTPLKLEADYFGDIKKPRLTMINEKVKEIGGIPKHGSLFAVEEEDGSIFVVEIGGDSGVGKSEMLAALMLKMLKQNLPGIRSIIQIAGDMFHVFRDKQGNLYGVGTEVGDFSRVTDFDPDFVKNYRYLFESSADSNVDDLNSRSTFTGFCEIEMPYKIDIILTASNYARNEGGITKIDNPENFLLYVHSHGERKEKATSQDGPNFNRTLLRYSGDKNIVDMLAKHGNYLDDVLDWEIDKEDGKHYLASSYKMIDKINIEEVVNQIFVDKAFKLDDVLYTITKVTFDIIKNRFVAHVLTDKPDEDSKELIISRDIFSRIFDSIASTPAGQPFIAKGNQLGTKKILIDILKGGEDGKGAGAKIQCGILSTELGKKGKEITGPQKAAEGLVQLIREVRIMNPEINRNRNLIKKMLYTKYDHIFKTKMLTSEIWRYNFHLFQLDEMRKAEFVRVDDPSVSVDLSILKGFYPKDKDEEFSPLLVTTNVNIELNGFGETYQELMSLPNYSHFTEEFAEDAGTLYIATGYHEDTVVNNMIIQLLLMGDYIDMDDLSRGRIPEKVNRETIAAAKYAVMKKLGKIGPEGDLVSEKPVNQRKSTKGTQQKKQQGGGNTKSTGKSQDNKKGSQSEGNDKKEKE